MPAPSFDFDVITGPSVPRPPVPQAPPPVNPPPAATQSSAPRKR
jgi:hypothetical protein